MFRHARCLVFGLSLALFGSCVTASPAKADADIVAHGSIVFVDFANQKVNIHGVVQNIGSWQFNDPNMVAISYLKWPNGVTQMLDFELVAPIPGGQYLFLDTLNVPLVELRTFGTPQIIVELMDLKTGQRYSNIYESNPANNFSNFVHPIYY
ncbi:MAG: hypothetical protein WBD20_18785 [Pirellulaceae bacterium]